MIGLPILLNEAIESYNVSDSNLANSRLAKDVQSLGCHRAAIRLGGSQVEARAANSRDKTLDVGDILPLVRRKVLVAIDLSNGQGSGQWPEKGSEEVLELHGSGSQLQCHWVDMMGYLLGDVLRYLYDTPQPR